MINIGAGPSNARNITDHVAVMRQMPGQWLAIVPGFGTRKSSATTCWRMGMCAMTMCSMKCGRFGRRFRRLLKCRWRLSRRSPR